jgi:hypothetical protein
LCSLFKSCCFVVNGVLISVIVYLIAEFADELKNARRLGTFKQYIVGRSSDATFADAFEKQQVIIRYLGGFDPTGEVGFFVLDSIYLFLFFKCIFCANRNIEMILR